MLPRGEIVLEEAGHFKKIFMPIIESYGETIALRKFSACDISDEICK